MNPTELKDPPTRPLSRWLRRLRRVGVGLVVLLGIGALFEQIGAWRDRRLFPPQGTRVDLGDGRRMYLDCRGSGSPTVLLEAGHWNWSPAWTLVQPQVAQLTRVCSYDRAGLGLSDKGPRPRSVDAVRSDLARLLYRAGVAPPYVLVGHSAGGMYQRVFAAAYRDRVSGLIVIDSDEPTDEADRLRIANAPDDRRIAAVLTAMTHVGLFRFLFQTLSLQAGSPESALYPEEAKVRFRSGMTRMALAINGEWELYKSAYREVSTDPLGDLPLVVIAALGYRHDAKDKEDWRQRQTKLAALSTQGRLVVLEDAAHYVPLLQPDIVTRAVREVVQAARSRNLEQTPKQTPEQKN